MGGEGGEEARWCGRGEGGGGGGWEKGLGGTLPLNCAVTLCCIPASPFTGSAPPPPRSCTATECLPEKEKKTQAFFLQAFTTPGTESEIVKKN